MDGIVMDGISIGVGCSDIAGDVEGRGGDARGIDPDGRDSTVSVSAFDSSNFPPSSLITAVFSRIDSDLFESMLALATSEEVMVARTAGLSGREGISEDALGLSPPLFTARARRS